jgi:Undecaprenyl-phosphate glucose phosphotransferase
VKFSPSLLSGIFKVLDAINVLGAGFLCYFFIIGWSTVAAKIYLGTTLLVYVSTAALAYLARLYNFDAIWAPFRVLQKIIFVSVFPFLLLLAAVFFLPIEDQLARIWAVPFAIFAVSAFVAGRIIGFFILQMLANSQRLRRNIIIVGGGRQAQKLLAQLARERPRINRVIGIFDDRTERVSKELGDYPLLGNLDALVEYAHNNPVDDVIVTLPWSADERLLAIISRLRELPVNIHLGSDLVGFRFPSRASYSYFGGVPMVQVVNKPLSGWNPAFKALEDLLLAIVILVLFSPVLLLVAIAVKLESPGPIFYRQKRYGFNNQVFNIYKFRSMTDEPAGNVRTIQATRDDQRVTRVGRFIRRTSLDELPQLLNVLTGDMSLVGPRPHTVDHNEEYSKLVEGYFQRHRVKPGITGWAQVCGLRGETDTLEKMEARVRYDIYYAENWSLLLDLQILAITAILGFTGKHAY